MIYTLLSIFFIVWAAVMWGWLAALVTLVVTILFPPLAIYLTMRYMNARGLNHYILDLLVMKVELHRVPKERPRD